MDDKYMSVLKLKNYHKSLVIGGRFESESCAAIINSVYKSHKLDDDESSSSLVQLSIGRKSQHRVMNVLNSDDANLYQFQQYIKAAGPPVQFDQLPLTTNSVSDKLLSFLATVMNCRDRHQLAGDIVMHTDKLINAESEHPKLWLIELELHILHIVGFDSSKELANYVQLCNKISSAKVINSSMVPATWKAIADLPQERLSREQCCICVEDLTSYVTRMPCLHIFHPKCIVNWLNQSHYCPICRFQMPTIKGGD